MALSVAINDIMQDFAVSMNKAQWLLSGYTIGTAAFLILIGKLADVYGRRKLLLIGIIIFALSSFTAAISNKIDFLLISRFIQGISSAMMMTTVISIITNNFPPEMRSSMIARWGVSLGLGLAIGPLIGGLIIHLFNWRIIFLVNIPICLMSYFLVTQFIEESKDTISQSKINWLESILLTFLLLLLITALSEGSYWGWLSQYTIILSISFLLLLFAFIFIERKKKNPLIDISLFRNLNFCSATFCGFISYFCMYGWLFIIGIYLQSAYSLTSLLTGVLCSSFSIAFAFTSKLLSKIIKNSENKSLIQTGFVLSIIDFLWMTTITVSTQVWLLILMFFLLGASIMLINAPSLAAATLETPSHKAGIASGIIFTIRWLGGSIGVAIVALIFKFVSNDNFMKYLQTASNISSVKKNIILHELINTNLQRLILPENLSSHETGLLMMQIKSSLTEGLIFSCLFMVGLSLIGLICSVGLKNKKTMA